MTATTVYQADTWLDLSDEARCTIKDWMISNDIDPRTVPPSEPITTDGDTITYWGMTIEAVEGKNMIVKGAVNDKGERCVVVEERTVPLLVPFPFT